MEKLVKPLRVNLFSASFSPLEALCADCGGSDGGRANQISAAHAGSIYGGLNKAGAACAAQAAAAA